MDVNTLVHHVKRPNIGIGSVLKATKNNVTVKFGFYDTIIVAPELLKEVDVTKSKTMNVSKIGKMVLAGKKRPKTIIIGNEVRKIVKGMYTADHVVTEEDLSKYVRIIE